MFYYPAIPDDVQYCVLCLIFRRPIVSRLMLGHCQKPSDTKLINHDGSTGAPGQFAYFHDNLSALDQELECPFQFIAGVEINAQLDGMMIRIGILLCLDNGTERYVIFI